MAERCSICIQLVPPFEWLIPPDKNSHFASLLPNLTHTEVVLQRLTDTATVQLRIEGNVLKKKPISVFPEAPNCEGKENIPR